MLGLGVYRSSPEDTGRAVETALRTGYRMIDTAAAYGNEVEVGHGIRSSGVQRSEIFLQTKMWISDYGFDTGLHAFDRSIRKLGFDTVDLYLLHQPMPDEFDRTIDAWKAAERLLAEGRVKAIGVSNFSPDHLRRLMAETVVPPTVNQVELHPFFTQKELIAEHKRLGIATQAWSPIGGVQRYWGEDKTPEQDPLTHPVIATLANKHGKTPAQIMLRWQIDLGHSVIPKSVHENRIAENFDVFDFSLSPDEIASIDALDTGKRGGPDPEAINTTSYPFKIED
ncbi:aldo/keto reductase [Amorphus sp. MBR-141]